MVGGQGKLAQVIGYSARLVSRAHGGKMSEVARERMIALIVEGPGSRLLPRGRPRSGRKPALRPRGGTIGLVFGVAEAEQLERAARAPRASGPPLGWKGFLSLAVSEYLRAHRGRLPEPPPLPPAVTRFRQRLSEAVLEHLDRRIGVVDRRADYVRAAVLWRRDTVKDLQMDG